MSARLAASARTRIVRLSAALAARSERELDARLRDLADASDADALAVEEALLQSYLFLGYPAALDALGRWRGISGRTAPVAAREDWDEWVRRGAELCRTVYASQYEELRDNVRALHPDMDRWMVAEGYGKVLGRPGLDLADRELCIVALLAVLDAPRQLYSHLRGALNAGASPGQVDAALADAVALASPEAAERARTSWQRVRERHDLKAEKDMVVRPGAGDPS